MMLPSIPLTPDNLMQKVACSIALEEDARGQASENDLCQCEGVNGMASSLDKLNMGWNSAWQSLQEHCDGKPWCGFPTMPP
jgi:hypothetical protein